MRSYVKNKILKIVNNLELNQKLLDISLRILIKISQGIENKVFQILLRSDYFLLVHGSTTGLVLIDLPRLHIYNKEIN